MKVANLWESGNPLANLNDSHEFTKPELQGMYSHILINIFMMHVIISENQKYSITVNILS